MSNINEMAKNDFLEYSMEVIKQRALPSVFDGCKPIHRRVLWIMGDMGLSSSKPTRKSAKVTGECMARAHAHGDSSIYDAMVRLAQPWKMRYPLVTMQGNMGNICGDPAAASRYTEAKLSPIGELMLKDIEKNAVETTLNYSGEEFEPLTLPSNFPNSLVNPNLGIAVGLASNTLPHNLREIIDALEYVITTKDYNFDKLLTYVSAPDFPTGGIITDTTQIRKMYETGRGSLKLQCKYTIEHIGGNSHIVITEIPYLTSIEAGIIDPIKKLVMENEYTDIVDVQNNFGKKGVEVRIVLNKGANTANVIEFLNKKSILQKTISMNNTMLVGEKPKLMGLKETLDNFIAYRLLTIQKIANFNISKILKRLNVLNGFVIAYENIEEIVQLIKSSASKQVAREKLINTYNLNAEQANAVLEMPLSKLASLEVEKILEEIKTLEIELGEQRKLSECENERKKVLVADLKSIKSKFGDARRTNIQVTKSERQAPVVPCLIIQNENLAARFDNSGYKSKKKESILKNGITNSFFSNSNGNLLCYKEGKILTMPVANLQKEEFAEAGGKLANLNREKQYIIFLTNKGMIKKTALREYTGKNIAALVLNEGDEVFDFHCVDDDEFVYILLNDGKLLKISVAEISSTSRATKGVKVTSKELVSCAFGGEGYLISLDKDGKIKATETKDYNTNKRTSAGQVINEGVVELAFAKSHFGIYHGHQYSAYSITDLVPKKKMAGGTTLIKGSAKIGSQI